MGRDEVRAARFALSAFETHSEQRLGRRRRVIITILPQHFSCPPPPPECWCGALHRTGCWPLQSAKPARGGYLFDQTLTSHKRNDHKPPFPWVVYFCAFLAAAANAASVRSIGVMPDEWMCGAPSPLPAEASLKPTTLFGDTPFPLTAATDCVRFGWNVVPLPFDLWAAYDDHTRSPLIIPLIARPANIKMSLTQCEIMKIECIFFVGGFVFVFARREELDGRAHYKPVAVLNPPP